MTNTNMQHDADKAPKQRDTVRLISSIVYVVCAVGLLAAAAISLSITLIWPM